MSWIFQEYKQQHMEVVKWSEKYLMKPLAKLIANYVYDNEFAQRFIAYLKSSPKIDFPEFNIYIKLDTADWMKMSTNGCYVWFGGPVINVFIQLIGEDCVWGDTGCLQICNILPGRVAARRRIFDAIWQRCQTLLK